jgi:hypothetical protein
MFTLHRPFSRLAPTLLALLAGTAQADAPEPLRSLFAQLPDLPATAQEAAAWVDRPAQRPRQPQLVAMLDGLAVHRRAVDAIAHADDGKRQAQAGAQLQALGQGMAGIGIDFERMQRDPAYAAQMQERLRALAPAQLAALARQMNQPLAQDPRHAAEAMHTANETAAVRTAGDAGHAYTLAQPARLQARMAAWSEANQQAARAASAPLAVRTPQPAIAWDSPACDQPCHARWDAYADEALPLMLARQTEALQLRRAALRRLRAELAPAVETGDRQLAAAQYGAAARSQTYQLRIAGYDAALAGGIRLLADWSVEAARHAAALVHCGRQAVFAPGTVCP